MKICNILSCNNKHRAKGMCIKHYKKQYQKDHPKAKAKWDKTYNEKHKEILHIKKKEWANKNKELINIRQREMYKNNHKLKIKKHEYYEKNKEYFKKKYEEYRLKNRKKIKEYNKIYKRNNPEKYLEYNKQYLKKYAISLNMSEISYEYALQSWSKLVKKRSNYICQICNFKGNSKTLHAHHIIYKSIQPKLSLNLDNGITLCSDCHYDYHNLNGWK